MSCHWSRLPPTLLSPQLVSRLTSRSAHCWGPDETESGSLTTSISRSLTTPPLTTAVVPSPPPLVPFVPSSVLISVASLLPEAEQGATSSKNSKGEGNENGICKNGIDAEDVGEGEHPDSHEIQLEYLRYFYQRKLMHNNKLIMQVGLKLSLLNVLSVLLIVVLLGLFNGRSSWDAPQRISPRPVRQLKAVGLEPNSASSSNSVCRTPKEKSPKIVERVSPKTKVSEKKRPSKISELESQISKLQEDLKKTKDELSATESWRKLASLDAEESRKKIVELNLQLEESQKQLSTTTKESHVSELENISQKQDEAWQSELETICLMENMKDELKNSKASESQARSLANATLEQLENAKKTVEALRSDGVKASEAYNSTYLELEDSRGKVNLLEGLVSKLKADLENATENTLEDTKSEEPNLHEDEIRSLKAEVGKLRFDLEAAEVKLHEEKYQSSAQIKTAYEMVELLKSESSRKESELEVELRKAKSGIEELKANLMDKETELQGISEENEGLHLKLERNPARIRESELDRELKRIEQTVVDLKGNLMDKETELQNILEENEILKMKVGKADLQVVNSKSNDDMAAELEGSKAAEREAIIKLGIVMDEANKSSRKVSKLSEQLDGAQAVNAELEAELRKIKVQSDQWRKAAEVAATILSAGNNGKCMERTGSMDNKVILPYSDDMDDDLGKKKNGNVLKKIGVLWKKPQK
ncbi:hypothetical protein ACFE04_012704 [Oxalis oulophora]